jgi:hypothetical protein
MCHLVTHYDLLDLEPTYIEGVQPGDDLQTLFGDYDRLRRWWPFFWGAFASTSDLE